VGEDGDARRCRVIHRLARREGRRWKRRMATEGHGCGRREGHHQKKNNPKMDLDFNEIRALMENLSFKMQQDSKA
jgi:hypothetical protein